MSRPSAIWVGRLYARLGLPFWAGAAITGGFLVYGLNIASYFGAGTWGDSYTSELFSLSPVYPVSGVLFQFGALFNTARVEKLNRYAESMRGEGPEPNLQSLYRFRGIMLLWALLGGVFTTSFVILGYPAEYSLLQRLILTVPFWYWFLLVATFVWTWIYSMYSIYLIGKLPMKLKPFTEDRALGLLPFGSTSLRLTAVYLGMFALATFPSIFAGIMPWPGWVVVGAFLLLAPILFLLPLLSLRVKLLASKRELSRIVAPRYTRAFEQFRSGGESFSNEKLVGELTAIDKIQKDIHQIHSWPIDTGMLVKLTAVVLSVIAIMTTKILSILLHI